jgi:hypothetical protein
MPLAARENGSQGFMLPQNEVSSAVGAMRLPEALGGTGADGAV